jgi:Fe-S-cluster-containing dehydrogenase component
MKTVNMVIDVARCEDCNCCFLADKDEHVDNDFMPYSIAQPKHGHRWIDILRKERGQCPMVDVAYLPTMCNQCRQPACLDAGSKGAVYQREDGIVIIDPVKSRGRKEIVHSCPYGHIWWNEERDVPQKWTMNAHLLDGGWKEPRCVQACATGAMTFLKADDDEMQRQVEKEGLEVLHPEYGTQPRIYYKNLYRFSHAFIGGSLALGVGGVEECAEGALVWLYRDAGKIGETVSDNYGDFKFDRLEENSGRYRVEIAYPGRQPATREVDLKTSVYLGTIRL